jgi:biotin-dependent carboxylase-like uncharacterized protein
VILEVLDGGVLSTVQDAGRPDWTHLGVPPSGATDPRSLAVANLLLGNDRGAAAIEVTLGGARFVATQPGTIALAGAELGAWVHPDRRLAVGRTHRLAAGDQLVFDGAADASVVGSRCYIALEGGVDVPVVLGSRSTCLPGGFGGLDGRPLRSGDEVRGRDATRIDPRPDIAWPEEGPTPSLRDGVAELRFVAGPSDGFEAVAAIEWRVSAAADRVGVRLDAPTLPNEIGGETLTHGVPRGAIQVPPDGRPIILSADHQTTGGYRVVGVVISADLPLVGQLRPGAPVRLVAVTLEVADAALRADAALLDAVAAALHEGAGWDRLAASAGS